MDVETEIRELKRRVGDLEGALNVLTGQLIAVGPAMQVMQQDALGGFQRIEASVGRIVDRLGSMELQVWSLRDDIPALVHEAVSRAIATGDVGA